MNIYHTPYTYHIAWTNLNKHYYGVRHKKGCSPDDLWVSYFTSSATVLQYRQEYGEPDVIEIRKIFDTAGKAKEWESKVLHRLNAAKLDNWLNQHNSNGKFCCRGHTSQTKAKISKAGSGSNNHFYGKTHTMEAKAKIGKSSKERSLGKKHSEESKAKRSASLTGKKRPLEVTAKMVATKKANPGISTVKGRKRLPEVTAKILATKKAKKELKLSLSANPVT